ncbi:MAG: hypothetical protein DLM70_03030 [Chloroflexi bacterium]|nr:MAG: hypothetical protein DLM70_03030 [Chloroflexota bacterium]
MTAADGDAEGVDAPEHATDMSDSPDAAPSAPVGLNWQSVAERVGVDTAVLQRDGLILVAGEFFPTPGCFFDPVTLRSRRVDVGDIALRHGYFLTESTIRASRPDLTVDGNALPGFKTVIPSIGKGAVIGLLPSLTAARQTKDRILRGSLGAGIAIEQTPLGTEMRVSKPQQPGRIATTIASHGGGVIAIDGPPVGGSGVSRGPIATGRDRLIEPGDARRAGTGTTGGSAGVETGSVTEAGRGAIEEFRRS